MSEYLKRLQQIKLGNAPPKEEKKYVIPKVSAKKSAQIKAEKEERGENDTELQKWFKARQKQLTGQCMRCGERYDKKNLKYAIAATAHILEKREGKFPSVKYHPLNWLELGAGCGCHNFYDNFASWEEKLADPKIAPTLIERFIQIEPDIAPEERKNIPEVLRQYIKEPF